MSIVWNSRYNIGIRSVDLQHQDLVEMINELEALHLAKNYGAALVQLMLRLNQYVIFHFSHEEDLMTQSLVQPEFKKQHLAEHNVFCEQLGAQAAEVRKGNEHAAIGALHAYLQSWLLEHIQQTDVEMAKQMRTRSNRARL